MRPEEDMLLQLREHDLPPRWDGRLCRWEGWRTRAPAFICPPPRPSCCEGCGSMAEAITNRALVACSARLTLEAWAYEEENRRLLGAAAARRKQVALWRLHAVRCPDCKLDVVWDTDTDEWWTLDHTDYGDEGSAAPS